LKTSNHNRITRKLSGKPARTNLKQKGLRSLKFAMKSIINAKLISENKLMISKRRSTLKKK